jgi:hypothetical protein
MPEVDEPPRVDLSLDDIRHVAAFVAACASRALPIFEASHPNDIRPRSGATVLSPSPRPATGRRSYAGSHGTHTRPPARSRTPRPPTPPLLPCTPPVLPFSIRCTTRIRSNTFSVLPSISS